MNTVKRVISSPDEMGRNAHAKICKTSSQHEEIRIRHAYDAALDTSSTSKPAFVDANSDMQSSAADLNESAVAATMIYTYSTPISDDEASSGPRIEGRDGGNNSQKETQSTTAISTRTLSESESRSDTTDTAGVKDWGWFDDMHDGHDGSTQMTDGNDKEDNKKRMKGCFIDDGKVTSLGHDIAEVSSIMDDDVQMNEIEDMSTTSGGAGEKRKGKKKKKRMLEFEFDHLNAPLDGIVNNTKKDEGTSMAVTAPMYVLEDSPSCQTLWRDTAGTRPPQPIEERSFYESMWVQNFERSHVKYHMPGDVLTATTPISLSPFADGNFANVGNTTGPPHHHEGDTSYSVPTDKTQIPGENFSSATGGVGANNGRSLGPYDHHHTVVNKTVKDHETGDELTVLVKGDNVFGTTVSKSFLTNGNMPGPVESVSISVGSYRVVESKRHGKYAQFLVIFCVGTYRDTIGVWKRYSDFDKLSHQVTHGTESCTSVLAGMGPLSVTEETPEIMPNAMTSWSLVKKRKRWYRCLDAGYLSIKVFLLERFLHDILYESTSLDILRDFVGVAE